MKKNTVSYRKLSTTPINLYKDDLIKLEYIINSANIAYTIESKEFKFDNISELIKVSEDTKIEDIEIRMYSPYITIRFNKYYTEIYTSDISDIIASGLIYNIESLIKSCSRKPEFIHSYKYIIPIAIASILFYNKINSLTLNKWLILSILLFSLIMNFWIIYALFLKLTSIVNIIPYKRFDKKSFFKKNKDQIYVGIITTTFGVLLGLIISYFMTKN